MSTFKMADPSGTKIVEEPKNVQTDHPGSPRHPKTPGKGRKESETQCGAISFRKMSKETLQNQGGTRQWIFARTPKPS